MRQPPGLTFTVRAAAERFRQGEPIRIVLSFASETPGRYQADGALYDRVGRNHLSDQFHLDPVQGLADPLWDYFADGVVGLGGLRSMPVLGPKPYDVPLDLAEWVRFDRPGTYRLYLTTHRVSDPTARQPGQAAPPLPLTSNIVELTVAPAEPEACERQVREAAGVLDSPETPAGGRPLDDRRRAACRSLRLAACDAAIPERVRRFGAGDCEGELLFGLFGTRDRAAVVREMERWLEVPEAVVGEDFLESLSRLALRIERPMARPPGPFGSVPATGRSWEEIQAERRFVEARARFYAARLEAAIARKTGRARAQGLLSVVLTRLEEAPGPPAPQDDEPRARLMEVLDDLSPDRLHRLLESEWPLVRHSAAAAALRRIQENPPETRLGGPRALRSLALRRLFELAPEAGRPLILEDMRRAEPRLDTRALGLLPDPTLPDVEEAVVGRLEALSSGARLEELSFLVARYATERVRGRVVAIYERRLPNHAPCGPAPFLAYLLRIDAADAERRLTQQLAAGGAESCPALLPQVAALHWSPALERIARTRLESADPVAAAEAAQILGRHGSPDAEPLLWQRLEAWHRQWKGQEDRLSASLTRQAERSQDADLGRALVRALTEAPAWLAGPAALERLHGLCLTLDCRSETIGLLDQRRGPVTVTLDRLEGFWLAGYRLTSLAALKAKLAQFPAGSVFVWSPDNLMGRLAETGRTHAQVAEFLAARGMRLDDGR